MFSLAFVPRCSGLWLSFPMNLIYRTYPELSILFGEHLATIGAIAQAPTRVCFAKKRLVLAARSALWKLTPNRGVCGSLNGNSRQAIADQ
jgi:hypothetical protein